MQNPTNRFKAALSNGRRQLGVWNTIGGNTVPELLGGAGFDWVLVDCEHSAIEAVEVLPALQAIGQNPETSTVVRPAANDPTLFKRVLDMGAQTLKHVASNRKHRTLPLASGSNTFGATLLNPDKRNTL